jgi:hypothetical protein
MREKAYKNSFYNNNREVPDHDRQEYAQIEFEDILRG